MNRDEPPYGSTTTTDDLLTPPPWRFDEDGWLYSGALPGKGEHRCPEVIAYKGCGSHEAVVGKADRALIEAAHDLLAACKKAVLHITQPLGSRRISEELEVLDALRTAIAKAKRDAS